MSQLESPPQLPPPAPNDDEDTAWALSTAHAMWNRGERSEAVKWLRRAAEAASEVEADDRALQLAKAAAELTGQISEDERATSVPPVPMVLATVAAPLSEMVSTVRALEPTLLGPPVFLGSGNGSDSRAPLSDSLTPAHPVPAFVPAVPAPPNADSTSPMSATYSDSKRPKSAPLRVSHALHVALFRDALGELRVAPHGESVPTGAIAVMIVALDPSADLATFVR